MNLTADQSTSLFVDASRRDAELHITNDYLQRWLFVDRLYARGQRKEMSFYEYEGPHHIIKYLRWIDKYQYPDWFLAGHEDLVDASIRRDREMLDRLELPRGRANLEAIGRYNAQDYLLQRFYPVPDSQRPRTILDFGAGHGRMANLALRPGDHVTELMIAIDGIPGSYLTQRAYYHGLGLKFADYVDFRAEDREFDLVRLRDDHQLVHLPTWRFDLVPAASVDLVTCVQVLKELPRKLVVHAIGEFERVLKPGGAIYVRDHLQGHLPNQMPIDLLLTANGFVREFTPHVRDRSQIHGVPRIWRKFDAELYYDDAE